MWLCQLSLSSKVLFSSIFSYSGYPSPKRAIIQFLGITLMAISSEL